MPNVGPQPPNRIREIRQAMGISQRELARQLGMEPSHLGKIENRWTKLDVEKMERIAGVLGVATADLVHDSGRPLLSPEEFRVLSAYRQLTDPASRRQFFRLIDAVHEPRPRRHRSGRAGNQGG